MSTSTAPSTNSNVGECVVCGKVTSSRCSACAGKGREKMFFCSPQHQKLVWFVHKHVCGAKGTPFRWPGFSQAEIDEIMRLSHVPFGTKRVSMLDDAVRVAPILARSSVETRKQYLRASLMRLKECNSSDSTFSLAEITAMRCAAFGVQIENLTRQPLAKPSDTFRLVAEHPIDFLIHTEEVIIKELSSKKRETAAWSWFGTFQHKYLLHVATMAHLGQNPRSEEARQYFDYTRKELDRFVSLAVSPSHPQEARKILAGIEKSDNDALSVLDD